MIGNLSPVWLCDGASVQRSILVKHQLGKLSAFSESLADFLRFGYVVTAVVWLRGGSCGSVEWYSRPTGDRVALSTRMGIRVL